jgi:predicted ABC-type ATPase
MPSMWIVAGPNGAGKSTFTNEFINENIRPPGLIKLNADEVTAGYRYHDKTISQDELNLRAARLIDNQVADCILAGQSFLVETVLSSGKYRRSVSLAQQRGLHVNPIYISLFPPELSPARMAERVQKGGNAVAWDKALERYHRSHHDLIWFAEQADILMIFDNMPADGSPELIFSNDKRQRLTDPDERIFPNPGIYPVGDEVTSKVFCVRRRL